MKPLFGILAGLSVLFAAPAPAQPTFAFARENDSIRISGNVHGYTPAGDDNYLTFSTYDLSGRPTNTAVALAANGSFTVTLFQHFEGDVQLRVRSSFFDIYTAPGTQLTLDIYPDKLNAATGNAGAVTAAGERAVTTNLSLAFQAAMAQHKFMPTPPLKGGVLSDSVFAARALAGLRERLAFLRQFVTASDTASDEFRVWETNKLRYSTARDIAFITFAGKMNRTVLPRQLVGLMADIPLENPAALHNWEYYSFLSSLATGFQIIVNVNPAFESVKKRSGGNSLPVVLDIADSLLTGMSRQMVYVSCYEMAARSGTLETFGDRFDAIIRDPYLRERQRKIRQMSAGTFKPVEIASKLRNAALRVDTKNKLLELLSSKKALFFDFWGDCCASCMRELPNYPKLVTAVRDKPITFVFLSAFTPAERMRSIKAQHRLDAEFINLSNDEAAVFSDVFGFTSYPAHFLLDSTGNLLTDDPGRADGDEQVAAMIKKIGTLLRW